MNEPLKPGTARPRYDVSAELNPSDPYVRSAQTFPTLTDDQVERSKAFGSVESLPAGTVLFSRGERTVDFFLVIEGAIEIYELDDEGEPDVFTIHGRHQFTGELDLFNDRQILVGGRMAEDGEVIRMDRAGFQAMLAAEPDIGEIIMRAFILRRMGLIEHTQGGVVMVGSRHSSDTLRIQRFLKRNGYPLRTLELENDAEARQTLSDVGMEAADAPVVVCPGDKVLSNPSTLQIAECLGIIEPIDEDGVHDLLVIGAGPAGLATGVYAASEGLKTLILETEAPGGQAGTSSRIENYLGFPTGISGQALAGRAQVQAQKFGATIAVPRQAVAIDCDDLPYQVRLDHGGSIRTRSMVIASGARYRTLDIDGYEQFEGRGIHYAATALEADLCRDDEVIVVGGGNSAGQAAVFLSRHARHVHMLVRSGSLAASMSSYLIQRIEASEDISLRYHTEITEVAGDGRLRRVTWRNRQTGEADTRDIGHIFLMIGAVPNTDWLGDCIELDDQGFIKTGQEISGCADWPLDRPPHILETSRPGIFAVGDVRSGSVKRVASAVGEGSISVQFVHQVLADRDRSTTDS